MSEATVDRVLVSLDRGKQGKEALRLVHTADGKLALHRYWLDAEGVWQRGAGVWLLTQELAPVACALVQALNSKPRHGQRRGHRKTGR
ncbi:MAG: hypothetical protein HY898_22905 [Deltaproteobacteria bacterium]|nr:hypothetical protein [Deltaproteobacteria bacterium]